MSAKVCIVLIITILSDHSETKGLPQKCGDGLRCVSKCCPVNHYLDMEMDNCTMKEDNNTADSMDFSNVIVYKENLESTGLSLDNVFELILSPSLHEEGVMLDDEIFHIYLLETGKLHVQIDISNAKFKPILLENENFCMDYLKMEDEYRIVIRFTRTIKDDSLRKNLNLSAHIISCAFLVPVLIVYSVFDSLRNIYGKLVISLAASWLGSSIMFLTLSFVTRYYSDTVEEEICVGLNFSFYFFLMASFFWMNIFSFDIWKQFRSKRLKSFREVRGEARSKFIVYSIYAWCTPLTMSIIAMCIDLNYISVPTTFIKPNIMLNQCSFGYLERIYYMYLPMLILICSNWIFFSVTIYSIWQTKKRSKEMKVNGTPNNIKIRLIIFLRLSLLTGIGWVLEVVSSFAPDSPIWYATDLYNLLIGVGIFVITVMNKKVYKLIRESFGDRRQSFKKSVKQASLKQVSAVSNDSANEMHLKLLK